MSCPACHQAKPACLSYQSCSMAFKISPLARVASVFFRFYTTVDDVDSRFVA
jgi:hypothetical protein